MNTKIILVTFSLIVLCIANFKSQVTESDAIKNSMADANSVNLKGGPNLNDYIFYFGDEFNGTKVDEGIWNRRRRSPKDVNSYDPNSLQTIKVRNGILSMETFKSHDEIGSAEISTDQHYQLRYGYFELKAQLSSGVGNECAFWLQTPKTLVESKPFNPLLSGVEIDIFENGISNGINKIYYSLHWNGYSAKAKSITAPDSIPGIYNGFHTFALEWTPRKYVIYVDGVQRLTTDTIISRTPEFIILGVGPGGFGGNGSMFPNPSSFLVDYIHVYKRKPEVTLFGSSDYTGWVSIGLQPGSYTTTQLIANGAKNNDISSVEIPSGWRLTLYDKANFSGDSLVVNGLDVYNLDAMENRASSLKIEKN
jgi:beta-glucanase (GH16 family)